MADGQKPPRPPRAGPSGPSSSGTGRDRTEGPQGTDGGTSRAGRGGPPGGGPPRPHGRGGPARKPKGKYDPRGKRAPRPDPSRPHGGPRPEGTRSRGGERPPHGPAPEGPTASGAGPADDLAELTILGRDTTRPSRRLETFPNQHRGRRYVVTLVCPEFTCLCPATGQPDFATITVRYVPDRRIVESKSLKLYLWSFRQEGHFHEHVTNIILDDLVRALDPFSCEVTGTFNARGGIGITVEARHSR
jgi:7-cyano-7-deazaguanine reductase